MSQNFKRYCKNYQDIENYEKALADDFKGWHCHHRLETHTPDGERRLVDITKKELIALNMYYRRPASELIFLTSREHNILHHKGKPRTEEVCKKVSEANKGHFVSEETRRKLSEARKGKCAGENHPFYGKHHSEETLKKMGEAKKGMRFFNNGKINIRAKDCPPGFVPGRLRK